MVQFRGWENTPAPYKKRLENLLRRKLLLEPLQEEKEIGNKIQS